MRIIPFGFAIVVFADVFLRASLVAADDLGSVEIEPVTAPLQTQAPAVPPASVIITTTPPTKSPSLSPTLKPTFKPTQAPVTEPPTMAPTKTPTRTPTISPTSRPSQSPTTTSAPTSLTQPPTVSPAPTVQPTTQTPSNAPSLPPTPTLAPSVIPTLAPAIPPKQHTVSVVMRMEDTYGRLTQKASIDYESVTAAHIEAQIESLIDEEELDVTLIKINVDIYGQTVVQSSSNTRRHRDLQSQQPLRVGFHVVLEYLSAVSSDPSEWIGFAFNSLTKRTAYVKRLQDANDYFIILRNVTVLVEGERPSEEIPIERDPSESKIDQTYIWIIVAGAAGGVLVAFFVGVILYNKRQKALQQQHNKNNKQDYNSQVEQTIPHSNQSYKLPGGDEQEKGGYAAEISVDRQDDISTLGDPVGMLASSSGNLEEGTASVASNYDYATGFLGAGTMRHRLESEASSDAFSKSGNESSDMFQRASLAATHAVFADDASLDEVFDPQTGTINNKSGIPSNSNSSSRFRVHVPAGKLGMVIDTPNGTSPVVHAIKEDSVLRDRVRVGDYLVEFDDENVVQMTAIQVSKLISLKADQQRVMVFVRANNSCCNEKNATIDKNVC